MADAAVTPTHNKEYRSRDMYLCKTLFTMQRFPIAREEDSRGIVTAVFDREEIEDVLKLWFGNQPIPVEDIRKWIIADQLWISFVKGGDFYDIRR